MAFTVDFLQNKSPVEKIGKDLESGISITGVSLKQDCSVLKPVLHVGTSQAAHDIFLYNYMYIAQFGRYYFIDDIVSVGQNRWEVSGHVDVLETYKDAILEQNAVIKRQQYNYNLYLNDPDFMTYNNDIIQTKKFSNTAGFNKTLNYILVVNGS